MLTAEQINSIHRLHWAEHWSVRKIARHLHRGRRTISQYLVIPARRAARRQRASKLDPFKATIAELLEQGAEASAIVICATAPPAWLRWRSEYPARLLTCGASSHHSQACQCSHGAGVGERFEIHWRHFGALLYQAHARKLYAFCLVECHSRKLFVEFTHSQSFGTFVRCHIHAFQSMTGIARELWYDNLATAIAEHDGNLVVFIPAFWPSPANTVFCPVFVMCGRRPGNRIDGTCRYNAALLNRLVFEKPSL